MISIQALLEERYPDFYHRHRRLAVTLSRLLSHIFHESRFQQFEREYPHLEGFDFVDAVLRYFDFNLRLHERERTRIPDSGRVVIVANHPIGTLDGLALLQLVGQVRPDVRVMANELLTGIGPLRNLLLPVNNMGGDTPRANLRKVRRHLENEGALIIFPAGEVSRLGTTGVKDGEWHSGFIKIARATSAPIQPIYVAGRNSLFFYGLSILAKPLSTLWLVREMFKQCNNVVDVRIGNVIPYQVYSGYCASPRKLSQLFRKHVYRLGKSGKPIFLTQETVAYPESRLLLRRELEQGELLGDTPDGKQIYLYRQQPGECVMRELGRLRELTFRTVGEGSGLPRDIDRHDRDYYQLVLWDRESLQIAGGYRLGCTRDLLENHGLQGLYTHSLFAFGEAVLPLLQQGMELGRSFVQPQYQDRRSLDYLWWGIGAFLRRYPHYRYLYGPVSISRYYGTEAISELVYFYRKYYGTAALPVAARRPFIIPATCAAQLDADYAGMDRQAAFNTLRDRLARQGLAVPTLYKHYMDAAAPVGVHVADFNIDPAFGDCVDGFVLVDLARLKPQKQKRYLGKEDYFDGSIETGGADPVQDVVDLRRTPGQQPLQGRLPPATA